MIIAEQKRKENIAEYLIYMWQIEDQLRAFEFDIDLVQHHIIDKYDQPETVKEKIRHWYENLILMMQSESLKTCGHLQVTLNILSDLNDMHQYLLKSPVEVKYQSIYFTANSEIALLKQKTRENNEMAACFNFLYGTLLLRLKGEKLGSKSEESLKKISRLISLLALKYKKFETGENELIV